MFNSFSAHALAVFTSVALSPFYKTLSLDVFRSFAGRRSPPQVLVELLQDEPVAATDKMEAFESFGQRLEQRSMQHFSMGDVEWKNFSLDWCCLGFYLTCLGVNCSSGQPVLLRSLPRRRGWNLDLIENASLELNYYDFGQDSWKIEGSVQQKKIRTIFS